MWSEATGGFEQGVRWSGLCFKKITVILFLLLVYMSLRVTLAWFIWEGYLSWIPKLWSEGQEELTQTLRRSHRAVCKDTNESWSLKVSEACPVQGSGKCSFGLKSRVQRQDCERGDWKCIVVREEFWFYPKNNGLFRRLLGRGISEQFCILNGFLWLLERNWRWEIR